MGRSQSLTGWFTSVGCLGTIQKDTSKDLVRIMVDADLELAGLQPPGEGRKLLEANHGKWHCWEDLS